METEFGLDNIKRSLLYTLPKGIIIKTNADSYYRKLGRD
jgi:hypothetical protein